MSGVVIGCSCSSGGVDDRRGIVQNVSGVLKDLSWRIEHLIYIDSERQKHYYDKKNLPPRNYKLAFN
jgi:hypothetical protein